MGLFRGDTVIDLGEGFRSDLRQGGSGLEGTVTNQTPFDLQDAMLLTGAAGPLSWGAFRRGETHAVRGAGLPVAAARCSRPPCCSTCAAPAPRPACAGRSWRR